MDMSPMIEVQDKQGLKVVVLVKLELEKLGRKKAAVSPRRILAST
jgi:hypothetical protein